MMNDYKKMGFLPFAFIENIENPITQACLQNKNKYTLFAIGNRTILSA